MHSTLSLRYVDSILQGILSEINLILLLAAVWLKCCCSCCFCCTHNCANVTSSFSCLCRTSQVPFTHIHNHHTHIGTTHTCTDVVCGERIMNACSLLLTGLKRGLMKQAYAIKPTNSTDWLTRIWFQVPSPLWFAYPLPATSLIAVPMCGHHQRAL